MNLNISAIICGSRGVAMAFILISIGAALPGEDGASAGKQSASDLAAWDNPFVAGADSEQFGTISNLIRSPGEISGKLLAGSADARRAAPKIPEPVGKKQTGSQVKAARLDVESNVDRFIDFFDDNGSGGIERDEFFNSGDHAFGWFDRDANGVISRREVRLIQARLRGDARRRARSKSNRKTKAIPARSGNQARQPAEMDAAEGVPADMESVMDSDVGAEMGSAESSEMMAP